MRMPFEQFHFLDQDCRDFRLAESAVEPQQEEESLKRRGVLVEDAQFVKLRRCLRQRD